MTTQSQNAPREIKGLRDITMRAVPIPTVKHVGFRILRSHFITASP